MGCNMTCTLCGKEGHLAKDCPWNSEESRDVEFMLGDHSDPEADGVGDLKKANVEKIPNKNKKLDKY